MRVLHVRAAGVAIVAAALSLFAAPGVAGAAVVDAACASQGTMNFSPGLTLMARPTTFVGSGSFVPCVSTQVVRADFTATGGGTLSCLGGGVQGTFLINWVTTSGGTARSTVQLAVVPAIGPSGGLSLALEGTVTEGLFQGDAYRSTFAAVGMDYLACLSPRGAQSAFGAGLATFLGTL